MPVGRLLAQAGRGPARLAVVYVPNGAVPAIGETHRLPELGATLRRIAKQGRDGFFHDLKAKVGEQAVQSELREKKIEILQDGLRPPPRRPSL